MVLSYTPISLLANIIRDELIDSLLKETPLLGLLAPDATLQKQKAYEWAVKMTRSTVSGRTITGALSSDTTGTNVRASTAIADYYIKHQFELVKTDLVNAITTARITELKNPVRLAIVDALDAIARKIQTILYTGNGVADATNFGVNGLATIIGQSGTFQDISRVTYPRWKSIVLTGTTPGTSEDFTEERFNALLASRRIAGVTHRPNNGSRLILVTTDGIERNVLRKLYQNSKGEVVSQNELTRQILPYVNYTINGIPVISDLDCPTKTMYFLNLSKLFILGFDDSDANQPSENIEYIPLRYYSDDNNDPLEAGGLNIRLADVSDPHPDITKWELSTRLQLVALDPIDSVSVIQDINETLPTV